MSSLENLSAKIVSDGEKRAEEILSEARAQADALLAERRAEAEAEAAKVQAKAAAEADRSYDRLVAERKLQLRDEVLLAKGQMLDRVFDEALERLNNMSKADFLSYVKSALSAISTDGEALLLPAKYGIGDLGEINDHIRAAGGKGNLVPDTSGRTIEGGFILSKDGIEQNNTFEALIGYNRYRLEAEIRDQLF